MLMSFLTKIKDHRRKQGRRYELKHILLFSILAILSGATSYRKIQAFIASQYESLDEVFDLNWKQVVAYTTIRGIIRSTSATELEACFRSHSAELAELAEGRRFVAVDGKVLRGSFDHFTDQKAVQILSAFVTDEQIILAHEEIAAKTNEIPSAQDLMKRLGLSDCIFTFDALHCQEKTLEIAQATDNDVIVQVKANQPTLLKDCQTLSETSSPQAVYTEPVTKTRNRIESRHVEVFIEPDLTHADKWDAVAAIVKIDRHRQLFDTKTKTWKNTDETAFYISTTVLSAQAFCQGIRQHWGTENSNHYVRDVTLGEDRSRIRDNPHLFAKLRSFALNILRCNNVQNVSMELFNNCMNFDRLLNYSGIL